MRSLWRRLNRRGGDDAGTVTAETIILLPVLALIFFGLIQTALWGVAVIGVRAAADGAARDGAAYGATPATARASANQRLHQMVGGLLTDEHVQVSQTATTITVAISGHSALLGLAVRWTATAPRERFTGG